MPKRNWEQITEQLSNEKAETEAELDLVIEQRDRAEAQVERMRAFLACFEDDDFFKLHYPICDEMRRRILEETAPKEGST